MVRVTAVGGDANGPADPFSAAALLARDEAQREAVMVELARRGIEPKDHPPSEWAKLLRGKQREPAGAGLTIRDLDSYQVRAVEWLEKPFLQRSAFHLLAGRKGTCKGTWLCGLAARVTTGRMYGEPKRVLVVTSEDSVELDFLPRLLAAGGVPSMVKIINGVFRMPRDLDWLTDAAQAIENVGLVVIDPIGNHLGGADTDKEGSVREAIGPLNKIADELDCMIVGVRHLGKDNSRGALSSVLGSTAWVDVPRCVILMAADDEDDMLFHAQVVAGNRGPKNQGLTFRLELVDVPPAVEITRCRGEGESSKDVEDLLSAIGGGKPVSASKSGLARELILDLLTDGRMESDALDAQVAQETGIAAKTVQNIRSKLKAEGLVRIFPDRDESGTVTSWFVTRTNAPRPTRPKPHPDSGTGSQPHPDSQPPPDSGPSGNQVPTASDDLAQPGQIPASSLERVSKGGSEPPPEFPVRDLDPGRGDVVELFPGSFADLVDEAS